MRSHYRDLLSTYSCPHAPEGKERQRGYIPAAQSSARSKGTDPEKLGAVVLQSGSCMLMWAYRG